MHPRLSLPPILGLCLFPFVHLGLITRAIPENRSGVGIGAGLAFFFNADLLLSLFLFVLGYTPVRPSVRRIGLLGAAILPTVLALVTLPTGPPDQLMFSLALYGIPLLVLLLMGIWMNGQGQLRDTPLK